MSFRVILAIVAYSVVSSGSLVADDSEDNQKVAPSPANLKSDVGGNEKVAKTLQEKTTEAFREQFSLFLENLAAGRPGLPLRTVDSSLLMAMHWQQLQNLAPSLQKRELARFLGRLEEECRVTAPEWWVDRLLSIRIEDKKYAMHRIVHPSPFWTKLNEKWLAIRESPVRFSDDQRIVVKYDGGEVDITGAAQEAYMQFSVYENWITVATQQTSVFVGVFRPLAMPYPLMAIEATSGNVLWTSTVWAADIGFFSGQVPEYDHCAEIVPDGDRVFIFGDCFHATYCECRRASDGYVLFRFIGRRDFFRNLKG